MNILFGDKVLLGGAAILIMLLTFMFGLVVESNSLRTEFERTCLLEERITVNGTEFSCVRVEPFKWEAP